MIYLAELIVDPFLVDEFYHHMPLEGMNDIRLPPLSLSHMPKSC